MTKTIYLPGAGGSATFWEPVAAELGQDGVFLAWPGLGNEPPSPGVTSIEDMVAMVLAELREPANLIAQSMGGLVAIKAALARPSMVKSLVLAVTSAGVPVADLGGSNWRADYYAAYPNAARWIAESREDLSGQLSAIRAPVLLLWGDTDPISPVAVGERLLSLLPNAALHVIEGADHDLALTHAPQVGALIAAHLLASAEHLDNDRENDSGRES